MAGDLAIRIVLFLLDGAFWVYACSWILTKFYGYPCKPSKNRKLVFAAVILIHVISSVLDVSVTNGIAGSTIFGFMLLFNLVYWMFYLREPSKIKKILTIYFAVELSSSVLSLINCVGSTFTWITYDSVMISVVITYIQIIVAMGAVWFLSWFSSRKRKEPMRFSLAVSTYVMCVLLNMVLEFFNMDGYVDVGGYVEVQPITKLRQLLEEGNKDDTMASVVLVIVFIVVFMFLDMVIRESEAYYFQKRMQ